MVLQSNFAKRNVDTENTPPTPHLTGKSIASRIRTSLHDAARRRRARTNGSTRTSKYTVEQAKRRSTTKSPANSIRFNIKTIPITPPVVDVEMQDAEPSSSSSASTIPVVLPKVLGRPEYCDISKEAIEAVDPELVDTDVAYIREGLEEFGPGMLKVLGNVKANPMKDSLPKELTIVVHDITSALPTHMMAIYGPKKDSTERRKVTLYPVHSLVLAAYCTKLPPFPPSSLAGSAEQSAQQITIPIRPICLPSPQTYPQLSSFLYTKRTDILLRSLMPCPPPAALEQDNSQITAFATKLAGTYTTQALLQHAMVVHGLWQNVCALGIFDDSLWDTIDLSWQLLLTAIAIGTGNPQAMITSQPSSSQLISSTS